MKYYDWNEDKNKILKINRNVCFEDVLIAIENNQILDIVKNPKTKKYRNQKIYIININSYAYLVPFVEDEKKIFLKTIIPSRKATKNYIIKGGE